MRIEIIEVLQRARDLLREDNVALRGDMHNGKLCTTLAISEASNFARNLDGAMTMFIECIKVFKRANGIMTMPKWHDEQWSLAAIHAAFDRAIRFEKESE